MPFVEEQPCLSIRREQCPQFCKGGQSFWLLCEKWSETMSTIEEVRAAEKKLQELVNALRKAGANDPDNLNIKVMHASEEYARAVHELEP